MDLCVVIPARNEERRLGDQLDALLDQKWTGSWEIIVVDNNSTDGTVALVERYAAQHSRVRVISATAKADQSFAANTGVAATEADAVIFCDADDIVAEGWLAAMAEGLAKHDVVTGPNEVDRLNPPWLANSRGRSIEDPSGTFFGIFPLVRGNNYGVRRRVWAITGPLQEEFSRHGVLADAEFSMRCWLNGVEIVGAPGAVVHYRYRDGAKDLWKQGFAYGSHRPLIARMLKEAGRPTPRKFGGWKSWLMLVVKLPTVVNRTGRANWLWIAGNRFGQVAGSVRHRTLML